MRKYRGTPVASKSLFFLGESYRKEKNNVKAILAYEALLQYYPESKFAPQAKTYLAQLEKEKQDPLAMLLMRDRRPATAAVATAQETASNDKLKDVTLTEKTEIMYEEPGEEKASSAGWPISSIPFLLLTMGRGAGKPDRDRSE